MEYMRMLCSVKSSRPLTNINQKIREQKKSVRNDTYHTHTHYTPSSLNETCCAQSVKVEGMDYKLPDLGPATTCHI